MKKHKIGLGLMISAIALGTAGCGDWGMDMPDYSKYDPDGTGGSTFTENTGGFVSDEDPDGTGGECSCEWLYLPPIRSVSTDGRIRVVRELERPDWGCPREQCEDLGEGGAAGEGGTLDLETGGTLDMGTGGASGEGGAPGTGGTLDLETGGTSGQGGADGTAGSMEGGAPGTGGTLDVGGTGGTLDLETGGTMDLEETGGTSGQGGSAGAAGSMEGGAPGTGGTLDVGGTGGTIDLETGGTIDMGTGGTIDMGTGGTIDMGTGGTTNTDPNPVRLKLWMRNHYEGEYQYVERCIGQESGQEVTCEFYSSYCYVDIPDISQEDWACFLEPVDHPSIARLPQHNDGECVNDWDIVPYSGGDLVEGEHWVLEEDNEGECAFVFLARATGFWD